ncbi:MAG: hypothetical protein RIQ93_2157 [Verrucomicrobiota bacterium]
MVGHLNAARAPDPTWPINVRLLAQQRPVSPAPYDSDPVFAVDAAGKGFAVWHSYAAGEEWIVGRDLPAARDTVMIDVAAGRGIVGAPEMAAGGKDAYGITWAAWAEGRWRVMVRTIQGEDASMPKMISEPEVDALHPVVTALGPGAYALGWVEFRAGRFAVVWRNLQETGSPKVMVSAPEADAFRPALVTDETGALWAFWDEYRDGNYAVLARQLTPTLGAIERVSSASERCLKPVAIRGARGELYTAWLKVTDVTGGEGVIDQIYTAQLGRRRDNRWTVLKDPQGRDDAAVFTHGLLAKIAPQPAPTGGYLGRRLAPMFVREGDKIWLLWERKAQHSGGTGEVTGELAGRVIEGDQLGEPVVLARGWVDYRVAHEAEAHQGAFAAMGSTLPRNAQRAYHALSVEFSRATPLKQETWQGWKPVTLPLAEAAPQRHEIVEQGKTYRLYWMDSHVHSGLTADAEGEPDEIMLYARDRGRLDALVMQENDFYNCPLTEGEYQTGAFYARAFSSARFLALPGYEWTQQGPTDPGIDKDQARFWRGNQPEHRTIIYPRGGGPLVRYIDVRGDITKLYDAVAKAGGVLHTQHATFNLADHPVETSIEVTAGWGVYFLNPGRIHATLNAGRRAGFIGTSDSHRRNPGLGGGLTGIYATSLTSDAVLEAYRAHRVFATSGARIVMEARANGVLMGAEAAATNQVRLTLHVKGTRPIRRATLLKDGMDLKVIPANDDQREVKFEYVDRDSPPGVHWYYWRVEQEGSSKHYGGNVAVALGNLAWSTPNWVRVGTP